MRIKYNCKRACPKLLAHIYYICEQKLSRQNQVAKLVPVTDFELLTNDNKRIVYIKNLN